MARHLGWFELSDRFPNAFPFLGRSGVCQPKRVSSMKPTKNELIEIIYECLGEVNEQLPKHEQIRRSPNAILFGRDGGLDSLGFVNFIALVEEKCEHKYGITVSLMEVSSSEDVALEDVGTFADSLFQCLSKAIPEV